MISTQATLRAAFWASHPQFKRKGRQKQNEYPIDVRIAWCDFVEYTRRAGDITESLAYKVTL